MKDETKFKPGQSGNPAGRPKGARSRLSDAFLKDLAEHWAENGAAAVQKVYETDTSTYLRVIASLLPKDVNLNADISYTGVPIPVSERKPLDAPERPTNGSGVSTRH